MAPKCRHETLRFGSGGYYVFCDRCHVRWVAIKGGARTEIERERAGEGLTTAELDPDRASDGLSGDELRIDLTAPVPRRSTGQRKD